CRRWAPAGRSRRWARRTSASDPASATSSPPPGFELTFDNIRGVRHTPRRAPEPSPLAAESGSGRIASDLAGGLHLPSRSPCPRRAEQCLGERVEQVAEQAD